MPWGVITIVLFFIFLCTEGGLILALAIFGIGFALIMFLPDSKPAVDSNVSKKTTVNTERKKETAPKHYGGYDTMNDWDFEDDLELEEEWDNSWKTGALPRDVSPYWDIDDPYEREALEFQDMERFWDRHFDD